MRAFPVRLLPACAALLFAASACDAPTSGDAIVGGDKRFESAVPETPDDPDEGTSTLFADLYSDYFGPTGAASCAGNGACHGAATEPGALSSGYVCGADRAACRSSLLGLVTPADPDGSFLLSIVRRRTEAGDIRGRMPGAPFMYAFSPRGIERLRGWIAAGANDD